MQIEIETLPRDRIAEREKIILNMGPQHPSTHGVLRVILSLDGETVTGSECVIGYLHRGMEKLAENRTYHQFIPFTDRLDYLASASNNLCYCQAVEKLLGLEVPMRAKFIRVILAELNRISSHLLWLATHALDIGAATVFLYCFRERELVLDLFEAYCGARLTYNCMRVGGVPSDLPEGFVEKVKAFTSTFPQRVKEYETLLTKNRIWLKRTKEIGILTAEEAMDYGVSGPIIRGSGVNWDIRKAEPYAAYDQLQFDVPVYYGCDVYDRYLVRLEEMRQSTRLIEQALTLLPEGLYLADETKVALPPKEKVYTRLEALIHHFHLMAEGFKVPRGEVYSLVEAPRGELGFYIMSDGSERPKRLRIRAPSFFNLQAISKMILGRMVADVVAVIGSLDIVLGEIDR